MEPREGLEPQRSPLRSSDSWVILFESVTRSTLTTNQVSAIKPRRKGSDLRYDVKWEC